MPNLGPPEILVVLFIALLVFGPKRLPEVGRQVGRGIRELRKIQDTIRDEINDVIHAPDPSPEPSAVPSIVPNADRASGAPDARPAAVVAGRAAPSRYRTTTPGSPRPPALSGGAQPSPPPGAAPTVPSTSPGSSGAHAPSRFRSPGV
jgi:sec-independent protein translocase protein TatA